MLTSGRPEVSPAFYNLDQVCPEWLGLELLEYWLDFLAAQGTLKSPLQHNGSKASKCVYAYKYTQTSYKCVYIYTCNTPIFRYRYF